MVTAEKNTGKAAENKKKKREALLNTAFELFTNQGVAHTSISNIVDHAGVAKGTFYLYFKDKYDLRDKLIRHEASLILNNAFNAISATGLRSLEEKIVFLAGNIISQLNDNKMVLRFISKNLSWAVLKHEISDISPGGEDEVDIRQIFRNEIEQSDVKYRNPEIMLYMVVELVGSSCYSSILNSDPVPIEELRPYISGAIRAIMRSMEIPPAEGGDTGSAQEDSAQRQA